MNLKEFRDKKKWTQQNFADFVGCPQASVSQWERGDFVPSKRMIHVIEEKTNGWIKPADWFPSAKDK